MSELTTYPLLGIDWGDQKIGVALSEQGKFAAPLTTLLIKRSRGKVMSRQAIFREICDLCRLHHVQTIVMGYVTSSEHHEKRMRIIANQLLNECKAQSLTIRVELSPEDFSTVEARRNAQSRDVRLGQDDSRAAMIMLQTYLDHQ